MKVSDKVSKLRAARAKTGNRPVGNDLTEMDKKILGIIGYDFAEGVTNSFDSFPEEQEFVNEMLSSGNTDILDRAPVILSCRADDTQVDYQNVSTSAEELNDVIENNDRVEVRNEIPENEILDNVEATPISISKKRVTKKRINTERLGVQFLEAREAFLAIETQNAQTMDALARNIQMQAEAASKLADAALIIAESDKRRNDIFDRMIENDRVKNVLLESLIRILENSSPRRSN